jgi:E3 ubiquitin-protein ligase DMA1/2
MHHPGFSCPLCRTFADLEADVEVEHRDPEPGALEDVDMGLEDVEEVHAKSHAQGQLESRVPESRDVYPDPDPDVEDTEDADGDRTSSSLSSTGAPLDTDRALASISIPLQGSGELSGFPGAEATPLNSTFLATLALSTEEGNTTGTGTGTSQSVPTRGIGLDLVSMSEGESGEEGISGVGGKRKR